MSQRPAQSSNAGYTTTYRRRRCKADWAGVSLADAFKNHLEYYLRLMAQRLFYQEVGKTQKLMAALAGAAAEGGFEPKVKPQISPCYTTYPGTLAAYAAIGLTAFLEFEAWLPGEKILLHYLRDFLEKPTAPRGVLVDAEVYQKMARLVATYIQTRLLLLDLSRHPGAYAVELYRLFAAAQASLQPESVPEILRLVLLYGDVLPAWQAQELHPLTHALLQDLTDLSAHFIRQLPHLEGLALLQLGVDWVREVCYCLARYLPPPGDQTKRLQDPETKEAGKPRLGRKEERKPVSTEIEIPPLTGPRPPRLFETPDPEDFLKALLREALTAIRDADDDSLPGLLAAFVAALMRAGGQRHEWEDMRSDLLELALRMLPFREGPIQGQPAAGHEVNLRLGEEQAGGEIFDRPVELSNDGPAYERLLAESRPIAEALRRNLYPNVEQMPETERFRTSGSLDPARLALAELSEVIFKRYRIHERADPRGKPVVVIACDASASLNRRQMRMVKVLAAAWLNATAKTGIQLLAGLYHSGRLRPGVSGPLVQWAYHPHKTPAVSRRDAARALVSLPDHGTGAQADALSLAFMLEEARRLARGKMVYLVVLSDCKFNQSFPEAGLTGREEMVAFLQQAYKALPGKLHITLVALGVNGDTGVDHLVDQVIKVSDADLTDYVAVAGHIGTYVSACIRERQRWLGRR